MNPGLASSIIFVDDLHMMFTIRMLRRNFPALYPATQATAPWLLAEFYRDR